jgi:hypothetical protein
MRSVLVYRQKGHPLLDLTAKRSRERTLAAVPRVPALPKKCTGTSGIQN